MCKPAEYEEGAAGDEVLRELPVVPAELVVGVGLGPDRRSAARAGA